MHPIKIKRIYDNYAKKDGHRVLVDRIWPRGVSKEDARLDEWAKDIAPSEKLRKWFDHEPDKFDEFSEKYRKELKDQNDKLDEIRDMAQEKIVTLLYGAKDEEHNQAVVLAQVLRDEN